MSHSKVNDALGDCETLYFGYGSNLWMEQMKKRCPGSSFAGVARLKDWRWFIDRRGYANVKPAVGHAVYGLVYEISARDEVSLDIYEGVPHAYQKMYLEIEFVRPCSESESESESDPDPESELESEPESEPETGSASGSASEPRETGKAVALVYTGVKQTGVPRDEYVVRMNKGIADALDKGVPPEYVQTVLREFIPLLA